MHKLTVLDVRGLACPLPVIRAQKIAKQIPGGQLKILCTDSGTKRDIPTWCRLNQHELIETAEVDGEIHFVVRIN